MSLSVGRAKLVQALKDLQTRWHKTRLQWDDPMSEDIEKVVIDPLEPRVRATVTAMEKMVETLERAKRECGPEH
jgi:hypothetical protein